MASPQKRKTNFDLHHYVAIMTVIWTGSIIISLAWNILSSIEKTDEFAIMQAKVTSEKELAYHRWNTDHGAVYAEVSTKTPPNKYLSDIAERDIVTPSGKLLTMINPAYMTRQANESSEREFGIQVHITGLTAVNPSNSPDLWEKKILKLFQEGVKEANSIENIEGKKYARVMLPLITEKGCLPCHTSQGYKEGVIYGGISVSVPIQPFMSNTYKYLFNAVIAHLLLWILGLGGIKLGSNKLKENKKEHLQMEDRIKKLSYSVEQNPSSIVITNTDGYIDYVNSSFTKTMGYSNEELRNKKMTILDSGLHPPEFYNNIWKTIHSGKIWRGDICNKNKDGNLIWELLSVSPIKDENGRISNFISVTIDDTERKQAKEALWKSEEKFRSISASANDAIVMKDNNGNISFWNKAAEEIFGYSEREVLGRNLHRLISPVRYQSASISAFEKFKHTGKGNIVGKTVEVEAIRKNGTEFPIELSISAVKLDDTWNAIGIIRDITERKKSEEELKSAKAAAEEASHAKSDFLATMSHELRTPLNAIIGFSKVLIGEMVGKLNEEQKKDINHILNGGNQLLELVNDILDISKIESGKLSLENRSFCLNDLINEVVQITDHLASKKSLEIVTDFVNSSPLNVVGDSARINQIVLNFVSNAIKFTDKGQIIIKVEDGFDISDQSMVKLSVQDRGIGISKIKLEQIFDKFTQADSSTTRNYGGTGLGLAICKKLTEMMGGAIGVRSDLNKGSTFWVALPIKIVDLKNDRKNNNATGSRQKTDNTEANDSVGIEFKSPQEDRINRSIHRSRILVVDDNLPNQQVAQIMLKSLGCDVDLAESGKEAIEKAEKNSYDLIFMDCQMPEMDGYSATAIIRKKDNSSREIPIIAMTAKVMLGDREKCIEAGMDDYIQKPLSISALSMILDSWVKDRIKRS